jgi:hypothetical protein
VAGRTQEALYQEIDLDLSWSEDDLPQVQRTKHVHALHPYLGKFIPQLVDVFLRRYFRPGDCIYDPFAGSGTSLVESNVYGASAIGCDISAFNCLLTRVKTQKYLLGHLELALRGALEQARHTTDVVTTEEATDWLRAWFAPKALQELLAYECVASVTLMNEVYDVARVVLSRAARSARQTAHFDLDFPREPRTKAYWCYKHRRTCAPVEEAEKFLRRYTADTVRRIRDFSTIRTESPVSIIHGDARFIHLPTRPTGIITSPPYPGLIDYHEQHRYAYELLELPDLRTAEIGAAETGTSQRAIASYVDGIVAVLRNARDQMDPGAPVVIVVNDRRDLYPAILEKAGLIIEERLRRHVNRRTGRRAGEFFEDVLVCSTR